jgi:predicted phosphodiesterase
MWTAERTGEVNVSTMRFGLMSDVHGNLPALRAVRSALADDGPLDSVIVAGDLLLGGGWPNEVWDVLTADGYVLVQGNTDAELAGLTEPVLDPGHPYQQAYTARFQWTLERIGGSIIRSLQNLPREYRVGTPAGDLLVVHASPRGLDDRAGGPHNSAAEVNTAYAGTGASAIAFGHWHQSFVRPAPFALLVNVASVSIPLDGRSLAAYSVLTATPHGWIVEQRRVPYDRDEVTRAERERGIPEWRPQPARASAIRK